VGLAVAAQLALAGTASATHTVASAHRGPVATTHNMLDCNLTALRRICTDPHGIYDGKASRFRDPKTGTYVGHDEPSVKFISTAVGSANTMNYGMQLPMDPAKAPTASGSVTKYGELSVAPWFGLPICDPNSYPQNKCTPLSDTNTGNGLPADAGSAFMELQFYPPGFTPFTDSVSCSATQWCAALNIDSLECTFNFASCNNNCIEPVNFSFLQTNGVPPASPAPATPGAATFLGDGNTLKMNAGDVLKVSISNVADTALPTSTADTGGLEASVTDVTTNQTGFIVASAANGFQNTSIADCSGAPFSFHAEYSSAQQQNQVPWAALQGGVLMEQEVGHGESCATLGNKLGFSATYADNSSYVDPNVYQTCNGGLDGKKGEGPCVIGTTSITCSHATTQGRTGPVACPTKDPTTGALCEFSDGFCIPKGSRSVMIDGSPATESSAVALCTQGAFQNGDLDFEGNTYRADWPNGSSSFPTSFRYIGPFTGGNTYPSVQFETDAAGSERLCNITTGKNCTAPPLSAKFYPFWSLNNKQSVGGLTSAGNCVWNFGNDIANVTKTDFGKAKQYGKPAIAVYGGTLISPVMANPETGTGCTALTGF
jgi:uncharacterized Zn-binding protein involved in type VI secretion